MFTDIKCSFTTRVHNGMFPSPTIKMLPGNEYQIKLINKLQDNALDNDFNSSFPFFKNANHTNLHTHGLHVSGMSPGDSIFTVTTPGSSANNSFSNTTYILNIPCNHFSGTFFYHPHVHGSTTLQLAGGAAGALIVEQESEFLYQRLENMPQWLYSMSELIIVVQYFNFRTIATLFEGMDDVISYNGRQCRGAGGLEFYTLNGEYRPTICLNANEWKRLRIVNTHYERPITMYLDQSNVYSNNVDISSNIWDANDTNIDDNYCELKLIARDGILLSNGPRTVSHIWLAQGQRADVAILCHYSEEMDDNGFMLELNDGFGEIYGYIDVYKNETGKVSNYTELTPFEPNRPNYMPDLMDYSGPWQQYTSIENVGEITRDYLTVRMNQNSINSVKFEGKGNYLTSIEVGSVNEWHIASQIADFIHPFHFHIFPFQVIEGGFNVSFTGENIPENWHQSGDYVKWI